MDYIDPILSIASGIYQLCKQVKANKERCDRVAVRVKALETLVRAIQKRSHDLNSAEVESGLKEFKHTLSLAEDLIRKYTSSNLLKHIRRAHQDGEEFCDVNDRLFNAYQELSLGLQVAYGDTLHKVFESSKWQAENETDRKADRSELRKLLDDVKETADATREDIQSLKDMIMEERNKHRIFCQDIKEIKLEELTYTPEPIMTTSSSEVYKGEYNKFTVAIKRYTCNKCPSEVRKIFQQEVETMRCFESPNILRMFGICIKDETGPNPNYLIIMEYCEKGSLRQVLESECELSWSRKAQMCLDAAKGVYRLHHTEEKSKVHGCINSNKFLVAEGYRVKLGGLELAKTETSLRRTKQGESSSLCYSSPQLMQSVHQQYNKQCEIYSFGIVLWEIATRKKPFENFSRTEIYRRVCIDKCILPLPDDCPQDLGQLINTCCAYDSFHRPSAGELVDRLRRVLEQLEDPVFNHAS